MDASDRLETAPTTRDDIAIWLFTSGSTGHAKAAVHLQHDLPYNTECYAKQVLGHQRGRHHAFGAEAVLRLRDRHEPDVSRSRSAGATALFSGALDRRDDVRDDRAPPADDSDQRADDDQHDAAA